MPRCVCDPANAVGAMESEAEVTATRTDATLSDATATATVAVVNAKNIKTRNAPRLDDVPEQMPSLHLCGGTPDHERIIQ